MEGDISFKKGRRATRRTKTLMSKKLCVYQISQLRKAETAVFSASCVFSPTELLLCCFSVSSATTPSLTLALISFKTGVTTENHCF